MTSSPLGPGRRGLSNSVLYLLALLLACACVVGGVFVFREHQARSDASVPAEFRPPTVAEQERYGQVRDAAEKMANALLNIDYLHPQRSLEAVKAASTGTFLDQYSEVTDSIRRLVTQYKSTLKSEVVVTAVSSLSEKEAKVLVATEGTVSNQETGAEKPQVRNFRVLVTLEPSDGTWLASDLVFVG